MIHFEIMLTDPEKRYWRQSKSDFWRSIDNLLHLVGVFIKRLVFVVITIIALFFIFRDHPPERQASSTSEKVSAQTSKEAPAHQSAENTNDGILGFDNEDPRLVFPAEYYRWLYAGKTLQGTSKYRYNIETNVLQTSWYESWKKEVFKRSPVGRTFVKSYDPKTQTLVVREWGFIKPFDTAYVLRSLKEQNRWLAGQ